jgi:catechol 2,3-dioxygenase-like lactoylglutathione lyase family enzyme
MLDHIGFSASNMSASLAFYENALKPLGITLLMNITPEMTGTDDTHAGFLLDWHE